MKVAAFLIAIWFLGTVCLDPGWQRPPSNWGLDGLAYEPAPTLTINPSNSTATLTCIAGDDLSTMVIYDLSVEGKAALGKFPIKLGPLEKGNLVTHVFHFKAGALKQLKTKGVPQWTMSRKTWWLTGAAAAGRLNSKVERSPPLNL